MLEVANLETAYGHSQVLFGISFQVLSSQVVSLLGRNGMGKTTTVRSIMGITAPQSGKISFHGKSLFDLPSYRIAKSGIGLVPEGRQIFPNLTVRENLVATSNASSLCFPIWKQGRVTTATSSRVASSRCLPSAGR
jgi:branched-chain amino acid transport system ATP-binding protein